ncbi:MAG TPA: cytochrome P450 [Micromonospora sp.]
MESAIQTPPDPIYDPLAPEVIADPYTHYARLRRHAPVYWHAQLDSWVVTSYAECRTVLRDSATYASDVRRVGMAIPDAALSVQSLDDPEHATVRHLLVSALRGQPLDQLAGTVRDVVDARMSRLGVLVAVDVVAEIARPVALHTICRLLGVDPPGGEQFEALSTAIVRSMDAGLDPGRAEPGTRARQELADLVNHWIDRSDGSGMIGWARTHRADSGVSPQVLANSLRAVLHAGYESASRLLGNALLTLARTPVPAPLPGAGPALDALVDELLRLAGPVQADARFCVADTSLGGRSLRRGDVVVVLLGAANRDPAVFAEPDEIDLTRPPGRHVAFGRGIHACLGTGIAILQLRAVLGHLAGRGLVPQLAGEPVVEPTATLRGLRRLPLVVAPAP